MRRLLLSVSVLTLLLTPLTVNAKTEQIHIALPQEEEYVIYDVDGNFTTLKIDNSNVDVEVVRGRKSKRFTLDYVPSPEILQPVYKDIKGLWAEEDIYKLVNLGLIKGYPDGTFRPNNKITRAEFGTILVRILELEKEIIQTETSFKDVSQGSWFYDYLSKLEATANLQSMYYPNAILEPNEPITREEMALWVSNEVASQQMNLAFTDANKIRFKNEVASAVSAGLLKGYPDQSFQPKGSATRAEAVTILARLLQLKNN